MYVAGLSAASGLMIVSTLALAGMVLNHIVLPLRTPRDQSDIYRWLRWTKRILIAVIIFTALIFNEAMGRNLNLSTLGILALSGMLQLLPGALGVIYWPEGNRKGLVSGLLAGMILWALTLVLPCPMRPPPDLGIRAAYNTGIRQLAHFYVYQPGREHRNLYPGVHSQPHQPGRGQCGPGLLPGRPFPPTATGTDCNLLVGLCPPTGRTPGL